MSVRSAARCLAAAALLAGSLAAGCDALPDEQLLRFLGFRAAGGTDNISVVTGDLFDNSTETVDAELQNATFTVGRNDDPGVGILVSRARVEYSLKGAPSYEFPVTLYLPAPESKGATTEETINGLPVVPEVLKQWIEGSGLQIHPSVRFTATVTFFARTDDGNDLEVEGSIAVELNDGGDGGGGPTTPPTVTIRATQPNAVDSAAGFADGQFTVYRNGETTNAVTVSYQVTAVAGQPVPGACGNAGVDYETLSGSVPIAAGSGSTTIPVNVCADTLTESPETVTVTLTSGSGYTLGEPRTAVVFIRDSN